MLLVPKLINHYLPEKRVGFLNIPSYLFRDYVRFIMQNVIMGIFDVLYYIYNENEQSNLKIFVIFSFCMHIFEGYFAFKYSKYPLRIGNF